MSSVIVVMRHSVRVEISGIEVALTLQQGCNNIAKNCNGYP